MSLPSLNRVLLLGATGFLVLAIGCGAALLAEARPILGVHPALKPFKFAVSIALFLGTFAFLIPRLTVEPATRTAFAWLLLVTMILEMIPIGVQALRGTTSHFNATGGLDAFFWRTMQAAIVAATSGLVAIAFLASTRPLIGLPPLDAFAWRAGLWVSLFGAASGFRMGGASTHTVGGESGGPGLPLLNWSRVFGDLRVSHFLSLHALQALPLIALGVSLLPWEGARWAAVSAACVLMVLVSVGTFVQALAGRPLWG